jgi:hypothetical protein
MEQQIHCTFLRDAKQRHLVPTVTIETVRIWLPFQSRYLIDNAELAARQP